MLTVTELRAAVERRLDEAGRAWLDGALTDAAKSGPRPDAPGPARWELDFASAGRHVRNPRPATTTGRPVSADRPAPGGPASAGRPAATDRPATDSPAADDLAPHELAPHDLPDAARILILHAARADASAVARLYAHGTGAERRAVLRALPHLGLFAGPDAVPLVEDALRTNDTRLVAAAVGPYAARHLPPHSWRQAVLKCLFTGVPLTAVADWERRARGDGELGRMLGDYARERTAAGRPVPGDLDRVLALTRALPDAPRALTREES
ncbi:EboA domain-containing protein [Streptomyces rugosispiralis]|uniref:EboA domain-containing protein n=1 Tax=Streptomyces rugosispiralis TaxID=2967341 RepID=A0ABT1VB04_9ACTN|nr:EboA domain-containing protein [Streptomyces rugosispiralis]MCQ8194452.1 EboA domain-containing protein [Streptomyces rugosispiralis]